MRKIRAFTLFFVVVAVSCVGCFAEDVSNNPPVARIRPSSDEVLIHEVISFSASDSTDEDSGAILTYKWDFDHRDGTSTADSTDEVVVHSYSIPGTYTVTLTVDDGQAVDEAQVDIEVIEPPEDSPEADAGGIYRNIVAGNDDDDYDDDLEVVQVTLNASESSDVEDGYIAQYRWDLDAYRDGNDDGHPSNDYTIQTIHATFTANFTFGTHLVALQVEDDSGLIDFDTAIVHVDYRSFWVERSTGGLGGTEFERTEKLWYNPTNQSVAQKIEVSLGYNSTAGGPVGGDNNLSIVIVAPNGEEIGDTRDDPREGGDEQVETLEIGRTTLESYREGNYKFRVENGGSQAVEFSYLRIVIYYKPT